MRFTLDALEASAEGVLDVRGRKGEANVPVGFTSVHLHVRIKTSEADRRVERLIELAEKYCPVQCMLRDAVRDFHVTWERT